MSPLIALMQEPAFCYRTIIAVPDDEALTMPMMQREAVPFKVSGQSSGIAPPLLAGLFLAYAAFGLFVLGHHEPWRDEAQAWLIARDLDLYGILFKQMAHEGSPALWHLLNVLLIDLGLPYQSQAYLNFCWLFLDSRVVAVRS